MIGGQYLDTMEPDTDLETVHRLKTGRLFYASVTLALAAAEVPADEQRPWRAFADELGMLFQVVDDILDGDGFVVTLGVDGARRLADDAAERAAQHSRRSTPTRRCSRDRRRPRRANGLSDAPTDWFDGYFEEEWLDEIALHIPEERTRSEVDFVLERLGLGPGAKVLDVACGHGRHSLELARRGFDVTGVDLSPRSIAFAREAAEREGLRATFVERDARELDFDAEFDAAINLFTSVDRLLRRGGREPARRRRRRTRAPRGGSFLVDTMNLLSLARGFRELNGRSTSRARSWSSAASSTSRAAVAAQAGCSSAPTAVGRRSATRSASTRRTS